MCWRNAVLKLFQSSPASSTSPWPRVGYQKIGCKPMWLPFIRRGKSMTANYRLVSLTCICCKSLEHIIVSKIMQHLSEHKILVESQHGFRSSETKLVQFIHDLQENLDGAHNRGHKQTNLIIMDLAKAFDKVPHRRLLYKLEYYGIQNDTLQWISAWLSGRTQKACLTVFAQTLSPCCLVFHRVQCWGLYYSWFL